MISQTTEKRQFLKEVCRLYIRESVLNRQRWIVDRKFYKTSGAPGLLWYTIRLVIELSTMNKKTRDEIIAQIAENNKRINDNDKRISNNDKRISDNEAKEKANTIRQKQIKVLLAVSKLKQYETQLDIKTDISTCSEKEFERYMRSRNRLDKALAKLTKAAINYQVSALKNLTVQIGDRFLTFPVWRRYDAIPFTLEDESRLKNTKGESVHALKEALKAIPRMLYAREYLISTPLSEEPVLLVTKKSDGDEFAIYASLSTWMDIESLPVKFANDRALILDLEESRGMFHSRPEPGDTIKVFTLRVNMYEGFEQRLNTFSPLPTMIFLLFWVTPIPTSDLL
jgi:hypothetical protein